MGNSRSDLYGVNTIAEVEAGQAVTSLGVFQGSTDAPILGTQTGALGTNSRDTGLGTWAESSDYVRFALFDSTTFPNSIRS